MIVSPVMEIQNMRWWTFQARLSLNNRNMSGERFERCMVEMQSRMAGCYTVEISPLSTGVRVITNEKV